MTATAPSAVQVKLLRLSLDNFFFKFITNNINNNINITALLSQIQKPNFHKILLVVNIWAAKVVNLVKRK